MSGNSFRFLEANHFTTAGVFGMVDVRFWDSLRAKYKDCTITRQHLLHFATSVVAYPVVHESTGMKYACLWRLYELPAFHRRFVPINALIVEQWIEDRLVFVNNLVFPPPFPVEVTMEIDTIEGLVEATATLEIEGEVNKLVIEISDYERATAVAECREPNEVFNLLCTNPVSLVLSPRSLGVRAIDKVIQEAAGPGVKIRPFADPPFRTVHWRGKEINPDFSDPDYIDYYRTSFYDYQ
jgi:hypothetical protein